MIVVVVVVVLMGGKAGSGNDDGFGGGDEKVLRCFFFSVYRKIILKVKMILYCLIMLFFGEGSFVTVNRVRGFF